MNQNKNFTTESGIVRTINFHHKEFPTIIHMKRKVPRIRMLKNKPAEVTTAYSMLGEEAESFELLKDDFMDGLSVAKDIQFGFAKRNRHDTPNRKVGRRLARMRMKFKPLTLRYEVTSFESNKKSNNIHLHIIGDIPYEMHEFRHMVLSQNKANKKVRLMVYRPEEDYY